MTDNQWVDATIGMAVLLLILALWKPTTRGDGKDG